MEVICLRKKLSFFDKTADYISDTKISATENRSGFVSVVKNNLISLRTRQGRHQYREKSTRGL